MRQVPDIKSIFTQLFKHYNPKQVIELGTGDGEFSQMIYDLIIPQWMLSFELGVHDAELRPHLIYTRCDIFENIEFIGSLITENTLVLCDNGNKVQEVRSLIPYMKAGTVIMAHDFGGQEFWGWEEIKVTDIADLIELYTLKEFHQPLMLQGAWMSYVKT